MKIKSFALVFFALTFVCCNGKQPKEGNNSETETTAQQQSGQFSELCQQTMRQVDVLQRKMADPRQYTTPQGIKELRQLGQELTFEYDPTTLSQEEYNMAMTVDSLVTKVHHSLERDIDKNVCETRQPLLHKPEELLTETCTFPLYLERGDRLFINVETEKPADVRIYNADSQQLLKTYAGKKLIKDSITINFKAVYLVELNPKGRQYANIDLTFKPGSVDRVLYPKTVESKEVDGKKGDFRARTLPGIDMTNLFEEPRKFTLRGQLKSIFSGSSRAVVAVQIPKGATDVLYSLRISTNEYDRSTDGEFSQNLSKSYKKVKMLGLPIYEKESSHESGLISRLLNDNKPPREEEAYINMYVFYKSDLAKKFQDGASPANLQYSVDYSTLGTQSCNGRIPSKGYKTIYLAFENERMRYSNYVWLEAVSAMPKTEYYKMEYTVK